MRSTCRVRVWEVYVDYVVDRMVVVRRRCAHTQHRVFIGLCGVVIVGLSCTNGHMDHIGQGGTFASESHLL